MRADVNVTSLVDVAFVLLIIFMITAPIMQGGVNVQLPEADARPLQAMEGIIVSVDQNGRIFIDDDEWSYDEFRIAFPPLVAAREPSGAFVRADGRTAYENVVRVLAVVRAAGITDVGLVVEDEGN